MNRRLMLGILLALLCALTQPANAQQVDNGNETVTDTRTGLIWLKTVGPGVWNRTDAMNWADALAFAGSSEWRPPTRDELKSLYTMGLGGTEGGPAPSFAPFVIQVPPSGMRWIWSSDVGSMPQTQGVAFSFDNGRSETYGAGSTLLAWAVLADSDRDGIWDAVDLQPRMYSNVFRAGPAGTGTITDRGDQTVTVRPNELGGATIEAAAGGGANPARISACNGTLAASLPAGGQVMVLCGSVKTTVIRGSVPMMFYADGWTVARATLPEGSGLTFYPETRTFTTDATNTGPITLTVEDGTEYSLQPGGTRAIERAISPQPYGLLVAAFLAGLALGLLTCRLWRGRAPKQK